MKSRIFKKRNIYRLFVISFVSFIIIVGLIFILRTDPQLKTEVFEIKTVASAIQTDGAITPENQAIMHFQTGGKLVYLPFKEGDSVRQGQVIAKLDTVRLEANLRQAEQDYTATDAVSQKFYDGRDPNAAESYDDKIKRTAIDAAKNKAYDAVVKARQDLADASLVSPMNGIILHEDITTINVNITPVTGFTVADPSSLAFRANVSENDIDFVSVGNAAEIKLGNGEGVSILGAVSKIYPDKVTLPTGQKIYQVDIASVQADMFKIMGQSGTVLIQSNSRENVKLVPTWTVLNHDSVWVLANGKPVLRSVMVGDIHGDMTEIMSGLDAKDMIITNPESIVAGKYIIL